MFATFFNCTTIIIGGLIGVLFRRWINQRFMDTILQCLALCVVGIGISGAISTNNTLCVIVCMVLGTLMGEALRIEERLDQFGDFLRRKVSKEGSESRFTEGFVNASVLFCVGAMAVTGAIEAGTTGYSATLISKSVIDGVTAISFAAVLGIGVIFSSIPILLYQGGLTLLFMFVGGYLPLETIHELGAVGGVIIVGIGVNMLGISEKRIKVGNMLPAVFLPILYLPISHFFAEKFSLFF